MPTVSYSTVGFADRDLDSALDAIAAAGFDGVELFVAASDTPPTSREATDIRRKIERRGLIATTVHGPARRNVLGAPTDSWRQEKVTVLSSYLRFTGEIGAPGMVIHGIPNPCFLPEDQPLTTFYEPMVDAMMRSVDDLVPVAAESDVRMLLENLPYRNLVPATAEDAEARSDYPLITMSALRPFVEAYPAEQIALVVDTGHAWTNGNDPVSEIETAGDRLWGTHLQDVDAVNPNDNHWPPTHGGLDWPAICAALERINYAGTWTFEVIHGRKSETPDQLAHLTRAVASGWNVSDRNTS